VTDPGGIMPIPLLNLIPVVADTAPGSFNVGPEQIAARITPLTSAIVVPHIFGEPADMPGIMQVARAHGLQVVEDCSQSHGSRLNGQLVGTFGNIAAFSTMFGKHHCTGGQGGLVYTRDETLYWRIRRASDRGKPFGLEAGATNQVAALNLNLDELAATIGRVQLAKLPGLVARRQASALAVIEGISGLRTIRVPDYLPGAEPSYWFLRLAFVPEQATCDKETYCAALAAEGLPIMASYRAALPYKMDWFVKQRVFGNSALPWSSPEYTGSAGTTFDCPHVESAMDLQFMLAIHANWSATEVADAVAALAKVDSAFAKS